MLAAVRRRNLNLIAFAIGLVLASGIAYWTIAADEEDGKPDVIYVPTPEPVVDKMLELAKPKQGEVLYDLGCGDGRIVVTAAKKFGVKGTGVDIDPERIKESNENAQKAGVTDKVKFVKGDLFKMDFKDADVVTLYLLNTLNEKLRPKLLDTLKPGTRIVSHAFSMGDWEPDQEVTVEPGGQEVYFWVIPAKVQGTWKVDGGGTMDLKQKYQMVNGSADLGGKKGELKEARLKGADMTFTVDGTKYTAKVDGDTMKGKADGGKEFTAKREGGKAKKESAEHEGEHKEGAK
jgi:SAM-dependent methyltransferase